MEPKSKNFSEVELRCKCDKCKCKQPNQVDLIALKKLQLIREEFGKPIKLTSAYRCENHPVEAKKEKPGTHSKGTAFDIAVPWGRDRYRLIRIALRHGFNGIGFANSFLHIDYNRESGTTWNYS